MFIYTSIIQVISFQHNRLLFPNIIHQISVADINLAK